MIKFYYCYSPAKKNTENSLCNGQKEVFHGYQFQSQKYKCKKDRSVFFGPYTTTGTSDFLLASAYAADSLHGYGNADFNRPDGRT
jgi:hypothetical protein